MPWDKFMENEKVCIYKVDGEGKKTGKTLGCHDTDEEANGQLAALNASEKKELADKQMDMQPMSYFSAVSFAELDAAEQAQDQACEVEELAKQFQMLTSNILGRPDLEDKVSALQDLLVEFAARVGQIGTEQKEKDADGYGFLTGLKDDIMAKLKQKPMKTEGGTKFPAEDYAYVPDPEKPSTWKLRLTETPGKATVRQLGRAAAAFSSGGFRGQKVEIPSSDVAAVKRRIRAEYAKLDVQEVDMPPSIKKEQNNLMVWKEGDRYRWFAVYSNKFRDKDNPPEILAEDAHKRFIEKVDAKELPYPELWHWHIPGSRWGVADWLAYDGGFAMASGYVDEGHEAEAEAFGKLADIRVSHGMPVKSLEYDRNDPTVIINYQSKEISDLPADKAANPLTDFAILKEVEEMIPDEKKTYLRAVGLTDEKINEIEASLEAKGKRAAAENLEFKAKEEENKDVAEAPVAEAQPAAEATAEVVALDGAVANLAVAMLKINELLDGLGARMVALEKAQAEQAKSLPEIPAGTPTASLAAMVMKSIIGNEKARVDGRDELVKSGPKENKGNDPKKTGNAFIDNLIFGPEK